MAKRKKVTTSDSIDIKERLTGPIGDVIASLEALRLEYPKGEIEIGTHNQYGETYEHAYLNFIREQTPLENELDEWNEKARRLQTLKAEARAFQENNTSYPKTKELNALKEELGYFAMAPMRGTLAISDGVIVVHEMTRGARLRDGTWVFKYMTMGGKDGEKFEQQQDEWDKAWLA